MPPQLNDNDGIDLNAWLQTIPGVPAWWGRKLRVLVACEYSATVRDAFRKRGFDAWSCDLLPTEGDPRWHIQGDAIGLAYEQPWDLLIAHPPCTDLAVSGARHFAAKIADGRQARALQFVQSLLDAPVKHIALENPVSVISSKIRKPDQTIQPWQFGHGETKATCLWISNLPRLKPSNIVEGREARVHRMPPGPNRWKERSRTFQGIADAMAKQWGDFILGREATDGPASPALDPFHSPEIPHD
jgi:site-specific DNA-cytosine methylase